jgi:guanylate kinase
MLDAPPRLSTHEAEVLADRARYMRRYPTASEALLWRELRGGRLGVRFVRQAVVGRFIVDFLAREVSLVVEVDGGYHAGRRRADERRDAKIRAWGYRVVRVDAKLVVLGMGGVLASIRKALASR